MDDMYFRDDYKRGLEPRPSYGIRFFLGAVVLGALLVWLLWPSAEKKEPPLEEIGVNEALELALPELPLDEDLDTLSPQETWETAETEVLPEAESVPSSTPLLVETDSAANPGQTVKGKADETTDPATVALVLPPRADAKIPVEPPGKQFFQLTVGDFVPVVQAQQWAERLRADGYTVFLMQRMAVGPYPTRQQADAAQKKLDHGGFGKGFVRTVATKFVVQLGVFEVEQNAQKLQQRLQAAKYPLWQEAQIVIGAWSQREQAEAEQLKISRTHGDTGKILVREKSAH